MTVDRWIRIIAGSFIMLSVLAFNWQTPEVDIFARPNWLWFTLFVGANLFQSGITRWCLMADILKKLGVKTS
jgi:hypothetical protein